MRQSVCITMIVSCVLSQNTDIYWGSYDLTIPGGSGAGNAVQHLSLPDNAPEFFQFAAFKNGPIPAQQFTTPPLSAPQTAPGPAPGPRPVPQQVRPAPQPQQLRVIQQQPAARLRQQQPVARQQQPVARQQQPAARLRQQQPVARRQQP